MADPAGLPILTPLVPGLAAALDQSPWWVVAAAAVPSLASAAWVLWRWWADRSDSRVAQRLTREQGLLRELEQQRTALSKEQAELFERCRAELLRCQGRLAEVERDRDRGWDLARWWHGRAHALLQEQADAAASLPGLEDPR